MAVKSCGFLLFKVLIVVVTVFLWVGECQLQGSVATGGPKWSMPWWSMSNSLCHQVPVGAGLVEGDMAAAWGDMGAGGGLVLLLPIVGSGPLACGLVPLVYPDGVVDVRERWDVDAADDFEFVFQYPVEQFSAGAAVVLFADVREYFAFELL